MKCGAVIVAAGRGERLKSQKPKAFVALGDSPLFQYSLDVFLTHPKISEIVLVVPAEEAASFSNPHYKTVKGGKTRQESVRCGLAALSPDCEAVLVHDAARPFVNAAILDRLIMSLVQKKSCIAAWPVSDTLKASQEGVITHTIDRSSLWAAQTPQAFPAAILKKALEKAAKENFVGTDDASLVERLGEKVYLVMGDAKNIKITTPEDLALAQAILKGI